MSEMKLSEFLAFTNETAMNVGRSDLTYLALGLAGETGEAVDCVKKSLRSANKTPEAQEKLREKLLLELGDVLWYWVRMIDTIGSTPTEVMLLNIEKLTARKAAQELEVSK